MKILVIRRDNIGDLVCTTPLLRSIREQLPNVRLDALVNSYNREVLIRNPDLNNIYFYIKSKHKRGNKSIFSLYALRLKLIARIFATHYDYALLPGNPSKSAIRFARLAFPKRIIINQSTDSTTNLHEVEHTCQLLNKIGLQQKIPKLRVVPDGVFKSNHNTTIGVNISARKLSQIWPPYSYVQLIKDLSKKNPSAFFLLLWAPGDSKNPFHPGDDDKAKKISKELTSLPVLPIQTENLRQLINTISKCDYFISPDGGAMHLAAGLGKPTVALFGDSNVAQWHPWGVPHKILQPQSRSVSDIKASDVADALLDLINETS